MKKTPSKVIIGSLSLCFGFALCYFSIISSRPAKLESKAAVIMIAQDGSLYLEKKPLGLNQLSTSLKNQSANANTVTIQADANGDYNRVVEVVNACKTAGVDHIAMCTLAEQ